MRERRIGIVAYPGLQALDVAGPSDVFTTANSLMTGKMRRYAVALLAASEAAVPTGSGLAFHAPTPLSRAGSLDTIVIPGGSTLRTDSGARRNIARWLREHARKARRVASVCTGIYALAESGLLDGREVTTHWRYADDLQARWKNLRVNADAIFIKDGKFYTSAGITAGIDLCLALVEEDFGNELALAVARELVVYLKRPGGQLQYSQPLLLQTRAKTRFGDVASWIRGHLNEELTTEALAERMDLSPRHLNRRFKEEFGVTPADFVEELRLDEARWLLANADDTMESIAYEIGYRSDDTFRRAFERRFGVNPNEYRKRFGGAAA